MIQTYVQKHSATFATMLLEFFILKLKIYIRVKCCSVNQRKTKDKNKQTVGKTEKFVMAQERRLPGCQEIVLYFYFIPRRLFFSSVDLQSLLFFFFTCDFLSCFSFVDQEGNHQRTKQRISYNLQKKDIFFVFSFLYIYFFLVAPKRISQMTIIKK